MLLFFCRFCDNKNSEVSCEQKNCEHYFAKHPKSFYVFIIVNVPCPAKYWFLFRPGTLTALSLLGMIVSALYHCWMKKKSNCKNFIVNLFIGGLSKIEVIFPVFVKPKAFTLILTASTRVSYFFMKKTVLKQKLFLI